MWQMAVLTGAGIGIYIYRVKKTGNLADLPGLLAAGWLGGMGLACLKLSRLQGSWAIRTWICFLMIYPFFKKGYSQVEKDGKKASDTRNPQKETEKKWKILYIAIIATAVTAVLAFAIEACVLGYVPFFTDTGHAYLEFHITGIHYFTVQCVMIPGMTVAYWKKGRPERKELLVLLGCNLTAVIIPVLCVSRFHLIFGVAIAVMTGFSAFRDRISLKKVWLPLVFLLAGGVGFYILISMMRNQSAEYLQTVFEIKNPKIPVWIAQPYMYITSNYDNFNCMVVQLKRHAYDGVRMMYPFFALTGLKFLFPMQISRPPFLIKKELSTFTLFYDAYYDFGMIGLAVFAWLLGRISAKITGLAKKDENPVIHLFYGQMAVYLLLSFFTTWFSNPTVWFRLLMTGILYILISVAGREEKRKGINV